MKFKDLYLPRNPLIKEKKESNPHRGMLTSPHARLIESNVSKKFSNLITVDLDTPHDNWEWEIKTKIWDEGVNVPLPNYITQNPQSNHAQIGWFIDGFIKNENTKANNLFLAVQKGFAAQLGGDVAYTGYFTRNPLSPYQITSWLSDDLISLTEAIKKYPSVSTPATRSEDVVIFGRNCTTFEMLRKYAYKLYLQVLNKNITLDYFRSILLEEAQIINAGFASPLPYSEVSSIVKSISGFCEKKFSAAQFSQIQKVRAQRSAAVRKGKQTQTLESIRVHLSAGKTFKEACEALGLNYNYWRRFK